MAILHCPGGTDSNDSDGPSAADCRGRTNKHTCAEDNDYVEDAERNDSTGIADCAS